VDAKTLPCFEKLSKGKCDKPQCPYSHENRVLEAAREQEAVRRAQRKDVRVPRPDPYVRSPKKPGRDPILDLYLEPDGHPETAEYSRACALTNILHERAPASSLYRSAKRQGFLHCGQGWLLPTEFLLIVEHCGAPTSPRNSWTLTVHLSSISCSLRKVMIMADGVTLRTISEEIRMPVSFVADDGTNFSATLEFSILDMPQQAIIGLPHIILNLLELYVGMLQPAKEKFDRNPASISSLLHQDGLGFWQDSALTATERACNPGHAILGVVDELAPAVEPWSEPPEDISEEEESPVPSPDLCTIFPCLTLRRKTSTWFCWSPTSQRRCVRLQIS
jgi:hypothetical protein